jgi:hypothetical protein
MPELGINQLRIMNPIIQLTCMNRRCPQGSKSVPEVNGMIDGLIGEVAAGVVERDVGGAEEGDEENVEAEDGAGDAEDDEEGGFHWGVALGLN